MRIRKSRQGCTADVGMYRRTEELATLNEEQEEQTRPHCLRGHVQAH